MKINFSKLKKKLNFDLWKESGMLLNFVTHENWRVLWKRILLNNIKTLIVCSRDQPAEPCYQRGYMSNVVLTYY